MQFHECDVSDRQSACTGRFDRERAGMGFARKKRSAATALIGRACCSTAVHSSTCPLRLVWLQRMSHEVLEHESIRRWRAPKLHLQRWIPHPPRPSLAELVIPPAHHTNTNNRQLLCTSRLSVCMTSPSQAAFGLPLQNLPSFTPPRCYPKLFSSMLVGEKTPALINP